jgi:ATP-dependent RNA helicase DDX3X
MGRRAKQAAAVAKKAGAEDQYFRECQQLVRATQPPTDGRTEQCATVSAYAPSAAATACAGSPERERELFQTQGAAGINFETYDKVDVEVSGSQAGAAPALAHFQDLGERLPSFLVRNIGLMNYTRPTPIQKHSIPLGLAGCDLMCCAQTGSGKTCAFLLPICAALGAKGSSAQAGARQAAPSCVVMAPTRELASQISLEAEKLCNRSPLRCVVVYGGADQRKQIKDLAFGCDIIVATPGRLTDFVERGIVTLSYVSYLVLDEADRMLDMGFEPQIRRIVEQADMPPKERRQTLLFSATFAPAIQKLAKAFLRDYVWIAVGRVGSTVENITQKLVRATPDKRHKLRLVVEALAVRTGRTLVFVQKKRTATWVKKMLRNGGERAVSILEPVHTD